MPTIVIDVMPKPEVLDPQGKAIATRLEDFGYPIFSDVRQGKRFELTVEAVTDDALAQAKKFAAEVLANPSTETIVSVREA